MKVHFAGMENVDFAVLLDRICNIRYGLFSVFPYIAGDFGLTVSAFTASPGLVVPVIQDRYRHTIMDSGLFTLMFGAASDRKYDLDFLEKWQARMISFVKEIGYTGAMVEMDCQKIFGVSEAWRFRKQLKDAVTNELINVVHIEDGLSGYDELIEFSDYIAISVPELRRSGVKSVPDYVTRKAAYAKNKKPGIKVHLLGCTQANILKRTQFCDTCDSTSWQQINRFGTLRGFRGLISRTSLEKQSTALNEEILSIFKRFPEIPATARNMTYYSNYAIAAMILKSKYATICGDQN
jgi:hypothetical protein